MIFSVKYSSAQVCDRVQTDVGMIVKSSVVGKCVECNRLRLTSDGFLKPCLFSDDEIKVDFGDIKGSILKAVSEKPENGSSCRNRLMNQIGG